MRRRESGVVLATVGEQCLDERCGANNLSKNILLSYLLTFIQATIAKVSDEKDKELTVVATYHTKLKKVESEK